MVTNQTEISSLRAGASVNVSSFGEGRDRKEACLEGSAVDSTTCEICYFHNHNLSRAWMVLLRQFSRLKVQSLYS